MRFKTKDLLVTVLPKTDVARQDIANVCLLRTIICKYPSVCIAPSQCANLTFCGPCSLLISCLFCSFRGTVGCGFGNSCGPGNSACDPTIFCGGATIDWVIEDPEDLVTIRRELQETIAKLDEIEKEGLPGSIRTRAEADALEQSLNAALEQVRAQKKNLK